MTPLSRRLYAIAALVLAAVIFVALNIAVDATVTTARLDLTQNHTFTLAKGTRNIIADIREPIHFNFYFSRKTAQNYAQVSNYAGRVRDLLREYQALSHGKIILREVDPEPYSEQEDEATADGLTGAPTDSGDMVYFGLLGTNSIDGREVIPFFNQERENYLEYDITSMLYRLSEPKKPKLAVISSLPLDTGLGGMAAMMQGGGQPFLIYQELAKSYDTQMLDPSFTSIPAGVDVLMIVHPPELGQAQSYAIDQFVLKGGRALVFVDPYSELSQAGGQGSGPVSSNLPQLFKAWGIAYNPDKVIADPTLAQRVQTSDPRNPVASYPAWLHLGPDNFDTGDQITATLQSLNLASAGALGHARGATTDFTPLVSSSKDAGLLDAAEVRFNPRPQDLISSIPPQGGGPYAIAARISGPARTAYPNGAATAPGSAPQVKGARNINVVVMADSDIFDDRFWVHVEDAFGKKVAAPFADNAAFVINAVENLTGSDDLISLRTRATNDRPFTVVKKLQADAQAQYQQEADALQTRLTDIENRLRALQQGGPANGQADNSTSLTPQQQAAIAQAKRDLSDTRAQLRDVQHNLRSKIDRLGTILALINIWLVPLLVFLSAVGLWLVRRQRRARAVPL
ncbi:MAG TPA: Gldg family protein [Rhizomicrobium sp.]|nr:Gldg family protein [Rhizomicrobium sp.]